MRRKQAFVRFIVVSHSEIFQFGNDFFKLEMFKLNNLHKLVELLMLSWFEDILLLSFGILARTKIIKKYF